MVDTVSKVAHYRSTECPDGGVCLEDELNASFDRLVRDEGNVLFRMADIDCLVFRRTSEDSGTFFQFIIFEEDATAAVIDATGSQATPDISEVEPEEEGQEFIRSQIFLLARGDHALFLTHNRYTSDARVNAWLMQLINSGRDPHPTREYFLTKAGCRDGVAAVIKEGVDHIDLGIGTLASAFEMIKRNGKLGGALAKGDLTAEQQRASAEVRAQLTLSAGRQWNLKPVIGLLAKVSSESMDEFGDDVKIVTKEGTVITQDTLVVKANLTILGNPRLLDAGDAASKLRVAFASLREKELIE